MRVLAVSHLYPSPGVDRHLFVHDQILALRELGVETQVLSPTPYAPRILWRDQRQRRRGEKPRRAVRDGIRAEYPRVLQPPKRILFSRLGDLAYCSVRGLGSLKDAGFDLVHAHQALPDGALAQHLASDAGVPYVVTVHGADVYQHLRRKGAVADRTAEVLSSAAAVMANSRAVAALLRGVVPPQRLSVVLNGTSGLGAPVEPAADYLPGRPLVFTSSYLIERKGTVTLIEAVSRLAAEGRSVHLAIAGEGPLRAALAQRAAALDVADSVHFLGQLPHERVLALMARAELFAMPSWDEAFGLVYTEAMAQGTPVIACRGEGPEDFIEDGVNGYLVGARDAAAVAGIIRHALDHPGSAAAVGEAGRQTALGLTWERNARLTIAVYEQALGASV